MYFKKWADVPMNALLVKPPLRSLNVGNGHFTLFLLPRKRTRTQGHRASCTSHELLEPRFSEGVSSAELGLHGGLLTWAYWGWWVSNDVSEVCGPHVPPWTQPSSACTNTASVLSLLGHKLSYLSRTFFTLGTSALNVRIRTFPAFITELFHFLRKQLMWSSIFNIFLGWLQSDNMWEYVQWSMCTHTNTGVCVFVHIPVCVWDGYRCPKVDRWWCVLGLHTLCSTSFSLAFFLCRSSWEQEKISHTWFDWQQALLGTYNVPAVWKFSLNSLVSLQLSVFFLQTCATSYLLPSLPAPPPPPPPPLLFFLTALPVRPLTS